MLKINCYSNIRVIICSCDKYADLWLPLAQSYSKFWQDCCWPITLLSETVEENRFPNISVMPLGQNLSWSNMLLNALANISEDNILLVLDDFYLKHQVNNSHLLDLYEKFILHDLSMLRLIPRPAPKAIEVDLIFGLIEDHEPYRVSTQASIWKKSVLSSLLNITESPWEFELAGTSRSKGIPNFAGVRTHSFPYYHHDVQRGRWFPWSVAYLTIRGFNIDISKRTIMGTFETFNYLAKKVFLKLINLFGNLV